MDKANVNIITALCDKGEQLSLETLGSGKWNTDAFLTLAMVHFLKKDIDPLPDSDIDEKMDISKDYLVIYMRNKNPDTLRMYMDQVRQIISEIYHEANSAEKSVIREGIEKMQFIG